MRLPFLLALLLLAADAAAEQIYKWTDEHGIVHYGDRPLSANAKAIQLPALQTYGNSPAKKSARRPSGPSPYGGSGPKIEVMQPGPDSTLSGPKFTVAVAVSPGLSGAQSLNYYLDGELQNPVPTPSTAFLYAGAEKGDHMISAAVVDTDGHELSRSEPVIVHLLPAPARP